MVEYKYVNKKLVGGKPKRIYKKQGSNKQYLKNNGKMMRVTEYRKKVSNNKKGGTIFSSGITAKIEDLKRIEIDTYQGNRDIPLPHGVITKKRSLKVILKDKNGKTINSNNFTGFVDFPAIDIKPDGSISANIILVIFQNNNNEMLKNAKILQKAYQKLDYHLSEVTYSDKKYDYDNVKVQELEDGKKYAVCSIDDVKYTGDPSINAQEFKNIREGKIKDAFKTNLINAGVDEKNTKVFYINNITFTSENCKELQALIETGNQVYQMLPKMATTTTDKFYKGNTPFLKVMVPSIWYTAPNPPQENIAYHKQLQLDLIMHLMREIQKSRNMINKYFLTLTTGFWGGVFSFAGAIAVTGSAMGAFSMVLGPTLIGISSLAILYLKIDKYQTRKFANKEIKKMGANLNELPYQNMMLTEQIQRQPPQQQSLQRQSPQQQFQRQSPQQPQRAPQQPFQRQSPQQQFQRAPQQPQRAPPQQQRAPQQPQRAPQQPQRAQSVPRAARHQSTQVGGKLKKKKNANKKQKK